VKKVFVQSFGCRASQADGAAIEASLKARGYAAAHEPDSADLLVINTCTVTHGADVDAKRVIRGLHRDFPETDILVTGCLAQRAPGELTQIEGVRWVVGNSHKSHIADIVTNAAGDYHGRIWIGDIASQRAFDADPVLDAPEDRTRPNLKIQDGCSNRCSFCIIPSVRGKSRSAPPDNVLRQVHDLAGKYCEVVLSGINLGRWGRDLPERPRFVDLLRRILAETPIDRLRISSVEPMDWSEELFRLMADQPRLARHVHIPLQSGSDTVLKRMYRKYRVRHYASRLEIARRLMPDAAIGADVMTGFPGESEAEFSETVRFLEQQPFTYLHVFTYSERPGTEAANLKDEVPVPVRRERTRILRDISDRKSGAFAQQMIGRTLSAVTLEHPGMALTGNFLKVVLGQSREPNQLVDIEIEGVSRGALVERTPLPVLA
jgi:threonylcarbamoyladenosine tRNA methylthiotransferase MtaB